MAIADVRSCLCVRVLCVQAFCVYRGEVGEGGQGVVHRWDHDDGNLAVKFMVRTKVLKTILRIIYMVV